MIIDRQINRKNLSGDQRGVVAITVTVFFMLVLSLIVLAFSQAARREQRQTLDNQLSRQAYYAAESGVNQTLKFLRDNPSTLPKDTCTAVDPTYKLSTETQYSCVLYSSQVQEIADDNVDEKGEVYNLGIVGGGSAGTLKFDWHDSSVGSGWKYSGCNLASDVVKFPQASGYGSPCDAGIIRVQLVMGNTAGDVLSRDILQDSAFTVFFRPARDAGAGTVGYVAHNSSPYNQGQVIPVHCTDDSECTATITGITTTQHLYAQIKSSPYKSNSLKITGTQGVTPVTFNKAQYMIDVTGRANDVLKRLREHFPQTPKYSVPANAIETMGDVCKQLDTYPGSAGYTNCFADNID